MCSYITHRWSTREDIKKRIKELEIRNNTMKSLGNLQELAVAWIRPLLQTFIKNLQRENGSPNHLIIINKKKNCDRDETINHLISECSKLAQREYKARHDWVGKVIHWEMCRKFQFDHTNKWYMLNPAHVLENDSHKLLWDFDIQTDHLIPARRPDLIIINNKKRESAKLSTLLCQWTTE